MTTTNQLSDTIPSISETIELSQLKPIRTRTRSSKAVEAPKPRRVRARKEIRIEKLGVVEQVSLALKNPKALIAGILLGGFVPLASYVIAHNEIDRSKPFYEQFLSLLVVAGLLYSLKTVIDWGQIAFSFKIKAVGFAILTEGVLIFAHTQWLTYIALAYLVGINGIATGCRIALHKYTVKAEDELSF